VDKRDFESEKYYLVQFLDSIIYIPTWMTDPVGCKSILIDDQAKCSFEALSQLSHVLDTLAL